MSAWLAAKPATAWFQLSSIGPPHGCQVIWIVVLLAVGAGVGPNQDQKGHQRHGDGAGDEAADQDEDRAMGGFVHSGPAAWSRGEARRRCMVSARTAFAKPAALSRDRR